jgi:uncharacterized cupin superfamily protein
MSDHTDVFRSRADTEAFEPYEAGVVHWLRRESIGDRDLWAGIWLVGPDDLPARSLHESTHDETFHILEGSLVLEIEDGPKLELAPGDIVSLPRGTRARWTILERVREFFVYA